ncbi:DUF2380 domain-containing protein [Thiohalorhabdus sp. Cl-TMA]|uniref:DUF2380 domain-containing protein n=1 Tax=Thiohalorhabdus methylotrophus TaxID=3242694 RepID=A0ABV4TWJ4_9GAMM
MRHGRRVFRSVVLLMAMAYLTVPAPASAESPVPVVIADFDYKDTSGEVRDQSAEHAARMRTFVRILREQLSAGEEYAAAPLQCGAARCSAGSMAPADLIRAAEQAGGRILVYGGVHKMSTLVQWGKVYVLDLRTEKLLLDRLFSFRGDNDRAFRRAAGFLVPKLEEVLKPVASAPRPDK